MTYIEKWTLATIIVMIVAILAILTVQPYFEARAFNKFSEKKATYWDAVFTDLRVEAGSVSKEKE